MHLDYKAIYQTFLEDYTRGSTTGEEIGEVIVKLAQSYSEINTELGRLEQLYNKVAAKLVDSEDGQTGKPISVAKAELLMAATPEYEAYNKARKDLQSVEQMLNALKSLQKGAMNEYAHMGNT